MSDASATNEVHRRDSRLPRKLRKELILAGVLIFVGIVVLPIAIYQVGQRLLGEYSAEGAGMLHLYGQILRDMGAGRPAAWCLVLSPWLGIFLLRALWWPLSRGRSPVEDTVEL